jgi:hypothetical protein
MDAFSASRRGVVLTLGITIAAFVLVPVHPARAECISSTPRPAGPLSLDDAGDSTGGAADIGGLSLALDASCHLSVYPNLRPFLPLLSNQYLIVQFALGPRPANPHDELVDVEVYVFGSEVILDDGLGGIQLPAAGASGFTVTLDELGITSSPMELGIGVVSIFDPTDFDPLSGDEVYGDYHPNLDAFFSRVPLSFTQPAPPTPPASPPAAPAPPPAISKKAGCVVPKLRGLTVRKAKAALKKAGCKYKLQGKGRVRSFSPKAGTATDRTVEVRCKRKKRRKKRR